jgi:hypothetical protein
MRESASVWTKGQPLFGSGTNRIGSLCFPLCLPELDAMPITIFIEEFDASGSFFARPDPYPRHARVSPASCRASDGQKSIDLTWACCKRRDQADKNFIPRRWRALRDFTAEFPWIIDCSAGFERRVDSGGQDSENFICLARPGHADVGDFRQPLGEPLCIAIRRLREVKPMAAFKIGCHLCAEKPALR